MNTLSTNLYQRFTNGERTFEWDDLLSEIADGFITDFTDEYGFFLMQKDGKMAISVVSLLPDPRFLYHATTWDQFDKVLNDIANVQWDTADKIVTAAKSI